MKYIKTINAEAEVRDDFFRALREHRSVNQAVHYLGDGAVIYYDITGANSIPKYKDPSEDVYAKFIKEQLGTVQKDPYTLVSLGCGNAVRERPVLRTLSEQCHHDVSYVGVDTSMSMLEMAEKELDDIGIDWQLISGDFSSERLQDEIRDQVGDKSGNIFAFLGATIGNLEVAYSADLLTDLTKKGDYVWLDVEVRKDTNPVTDRKIYESFRNYISDKATLSHKFHALSRLGITPDAGDVFIRMVPEEGINALKFYLVYKVTKQISIVRRGRHMSLLPGNEVILQVYRAYDPGGLINFFELRGFKAVAHNFFGIMGQFLFQRE